MTIPDDFDWDSYESQSQYDIDDIWNSSNSFYSNTVDIISRTMYHDEIFVLKHILGAYTCFHSIAAKFAPILFLSGSSGTGKSNITLLIASLRGVQKTILGGSSTFASVRNTLNRSRWKYYSTELAGGNDYSRSNEKLSMLFWADIKAANLQDPKMYGLLRNGTSRFEDKLTIAGEDGKNLEFYVFCPKVISSIEDFYTQAKFSELKRRLMIVRTQKLKANSMSWIESAINPNEYNFSNCENYFVDFWSNDRLNELANAIKSSRLPQKLAKKGWHSDYVAAYTCIMQQHLIMQDWTVKELIELWEKYLHLQENWLSSSQLSIDTVVKNFVQPFETEAIDIELPECCITHKQLVAQLMNCKMSKGNDQIPEIMNIMGYSHKFVGNELIWVKPLR